MATGRSDAPRCIYPSSLAIPRSLSPRRGGEHGRRAGLEGVASRRNFTTHRVPAREVLPYVARLKEVGLSLLTYGLLKLDVFKGSGITRIFAFKSTSVTCWGVNIPIPEMDILLESLRIIMWQCPGSTKKEPIETTVYALAIEPIETLVVQSFSHVELNNGNKTVFGPLMFLGDNMISFTSKDAVLLVETTKGGPWTAWPLAILRFTSMTLAFGFSRFLNLRVNSSINPILSLWLASCSCSSSTASASELPEIAGGPETIREGRAEIFADKSNSVFYNKAQVNNRDLSVAVLRWFILKRQEEHDIKLKARHEIPPEQHANELDPAITGSEDTALREESNPKPPKVLEALAASGLRAIRYALEVDGIGEVIAVDNNEVAIEACKKNIYHNGILASSKVVPHLADARIYMLTHPKEFDVVDLDPYGSPAAFLDSAVQCVADGGVLMCSATDMAVLAGGNAEVCFSKYGSYPVRGKYCHEMALRILLACIESHAIRHKRYIVPVISVHMDFYIRVFVRIFTSASTVKSSPLKFSHVYQCVGCSSFHLQNVGRINPKDKRNIALPNFCPTVPQECSECAHKFVMGGPIWSDPIHQKEWAASILSNIRAMSGVFQAYAKISAILTSISEELPNAPLFVSLHSLCATLKCTSPTMVMFHSSIRNAGYQISGSHVDPLALKTDAPMSVIWDIMRCWVKLHPVKSQPENCPGSRILSQEPQLQASFSQVTGGLVARKSPRFVPNPEKHWGPKMKAGRPLKTLPNEKL